MRRAEILGIAGLVGSGRSRIARFLIGLEGDHGGEVLVDGQPYHPRSLPHAIRHGVMLVPEDRKGLGLILSLGVDRNIALPSPKRLQRWGWWIGEANVSWPTAWCPTSTSASLT